MSDLSGNPQKKSAKNTIQDILNAVYIRAANLLGVVFYGVNGSNYIAIRVKATGAATSGYVLTSAAGAGAAGVTRVSSDVLSTVPAKVSIVYGGSAPSRVSADVFKTVVNAASGLFIRFGTGAAKISAIQVANHKISAIQVANHKISAIQVANNKVSAISLPGNVAASGIFIRTGLGVKVSAIQVANHKVSAIQVANHKVSAIQVANNKASTIFSSNTKVSAIQLANAKVSVINSPNATAAFKNVSLTASAIWNAAGTATIIAASAGVTRRLTDIFITSYADSTKVRLFMGGGGRKLTPWDKLMNGSGRGHSFVRVISVAGSAVKLSASQGSGQVLIHRM